MKTHSGISTTDYASRRKELLTLIKKLRAAGAQNELDLPQIAVIGNQSAGKSSLVEALSGITVPRDAGTCTRCPIECRLSSSDEAWSCRISIRCAFDPTGGPLRDISEKPFGIRITDKSQVELCLRRAQFAILNPEIPWDKILTASAEELRMWSDTSSRFSKNVICVDLEGPELTDLSFIDLPGLIQNADPDAVELVENIVTSHIASNCIILVAVPMTDDIENQKAFRLARQEDPEGNRTIGVLTKPDMLSSSSKKVSKNWLDVLEGTRHRLKHGYYCTRQPDDDERATHPTFEQNGEKEELFFSETMPWCTSTTPERFGTKNLAAALSRLLVDTIKSSIPRIMTETNDRLIACRKELLNIPPSLAEEPATFVLSQITKFCSDFHITVQGFIGASLVQSHLTTYRAFKCAIRETIPIFVPFTDSEKAVTFEDAYEEDEDDDESQSSASDVTRSPVNLTYIREHIARSITRELPNHVPFAATAALIKDFQRTWPNCINKCLEEIRVSTLTVLLDKIDYDFARFAALKIHLKSLIPEIVESHRATCASILAKIIEVELMPFTQNAHYLKSKTEFWLARYKSARSGIHTGTTAKLGTARTEARSSKTSPNLEQPALMFPPPKTSTDYLALFSVLTPFQSYHTPVWTEGDCFDNITGPGDLVHSKFSVEELRFRAYSAGHTGSSSLSCTPGTPSKTTSSASSRAYRFQKARESTPSVSGSTASTMLDNDTVSSTPSTPTWNTAKQVDVPSFLGFSGDQESATETEGAKFKTILNMLAEVGLHVSSKEELLAKIVPMNEHETELTLMAEVRSYAGIAYKRVIDYVPGFIDLMLVRAITQELQTFLVNKLELGTSEGTELCSSLLAEDPDVVAKRDELVSRKNILESVHRELISFGLH